MENNIKNKDLNKEQKRKINRIFLGIFLFITVLVLILKLVDEILLDLGFVDGKFNINYWKDDEFIKNAYLTDNKPVLQMIERHPNLFWSFTQFTWITTVLILIIMTLRWFKYEQEDLPRWIRWVMLQRTLSLMTMYDVVVGSVFWIGMYGTFMDNFNPDLLALEIIITVIVHAIIPLMMILYSIIYLTRDKRASVLNEGFILKGMIYPLSYSLYYIIISQIWEDPYAVSDLHNNFVGEIWKVPVLLLVIYILLGGMLLLHNVLLLKYNDDYDPKDDYEIKLRVKMKSEKYEEKLLRKHKK